MSLKAKDVVQAGRPLDEADKALVLLHGRFASAESILPLAEALGAGDFAVAAPQAPEGQWYPQGFVAPRQQNEPYLTDALARLDGLLTELKSAGIHRERVVLAGFSQGACLAAEFAASRAQRYGGLLIFSGGLIGQGASVSAEAYAGSLSGTPVFSGCSDVDPHIPLERVKETSQILSGMGASVDEQIYPGMGHTITEAELEQARRVIVGSS